MTYQEKIVWGSLGALAATFGPYFIWVSLLSRSADAPTLQRLVWCALAAGGYGLLTGLCHLTVRMTSSTDSVGFLDERDRAIDLRSLKAAYWVLLVSMIVVGCVMPFNKSGWDVVNAGIAGLALADSTRLSLAALSYRRSAA